jgi:anti-sigma factor RsiW
MASIAHSDTDLLAYLDEMLPAERMTAIEADLRRDEALRLRLAALSRRRDEGIHSVGEIWRRRRLSCPSRKQLGSFLLGTLESSLAEYVEFHVRSVGCRICAANLDDLERASRSGATTAESSERRRRFFESSAGHLRGLSSGRVS